MRAWYLTGQVRLEWQTDKAVKCTFDWSDDHGYAAHGLWIPLSVLHPDCLDIVEEAIEGELTEISIAKWWLDENL